MSLACKESFSITWRIKNFSMCSQQFGHSIGSPVILTKRFGNSKWKLKLYPKGSTIKGFVEFFIVCESLGKYKSIKLDFSLSVVQNASVKKLTATNDYNKIRNSYGFLKWLEIEDILKENRNDTFELNLLMKFKNCYDSDNDDEILEALYRDSTSGRFSLNFNKCCIETVIPVQTKIVFWPIRNFQTLFVKKRITLPVFSAVSEFPTFYVTLYKTTESLCIEIKSEEEVEEDISGFVRCSVSVDNAPGDIHCEAKVEFLFESDNVWKFPTFLNTSSEIDDRYFKHTKGVLYLRFDFAISSEDKMYHSEINYFDPVFLPPENKVRLDVLTSPSPDDEPSIVSLRTTGDRSFKVHKSVLEASSEVFSAMFANDMKEKNSGVVDIPDVDPQTLGLLVAFFYSGTVPELSVGDIGKLFALAHTYQVLSLMDLCTSILVSSMTSSNVCDILSLADLYGNDRLWEFAEAFVIKNSDRDRILMSPEWKKLMVDNPSLVARVMYKMLIK